MCAVRVRAQGRNARAWASAYGGRGAPVFGCRQAPAARFADEIRTGGGGSGCGPGRNDRASPGLELPRTSAAAAAAAGSRAMKTVRRRRHVRFGPGQRLPDPGAAHRVAVTMAGVSN